MLPPKHLQPQRAPPPPCLSVCVITGQPAKYRCPQTPNVQHLHVLSPSHTLNPSLQGQPAVLTHCSVGKRWLSQSSHRALHSCLPVSPCSACSNLSPRVFCVHDFRVASCMWCQGMQFRNREQGQHGRACHGVRLCATCRDPETGMPYASVEAFQELRAKAGDSHFLQTHRTKRRRTGAGTPLGPPMLAPSLLSAALRLSGARVSLVLHKVCL